MMKNIVFDFTIILSVVSFFHANVFFSLSINDSHHNKKNNEQQNEQRYYFRNLKSNVVDPKTIQPKVQTPSKKVETHEQNKHQQPQSEPHRKKPFLKKEIEKGGRLGNMMFQWASIMGVAELNDLRPCHIPKTGNYWQEMLDAFEGPFPDCPNSDIVAYKWTDQQLDQMLPLRTNFDDGQDVGIVEPTYLEKYHYFAHIPHLVYKSFTIRDEYLMKAHKYLEPFQRQNPNIIKIGIHVRRGDLQRLDKLTWLKQRQFLVSSSYFENAMTFFRKKFKKRQQDIQFFVASNTMSWCKNQTMFQSEDVVFLPDSSEQNPITDFTILTQMDHLIISFGTFSWWAAYLGPTSRPEGLVVYHDPVTVNNDFLPSWIHVPDEPDMSQNYKTYEKFFGDSSM